MNHTTADLEGADHYAFIRELGLDLDSIDLIDVAYQDIDQFEDLDSTPWHWSGAATDADATLIADLAAEVFASGLDLTVADFTRYTVLFAELRDDALAADARTDPDLVDLDLAAAVPAHRRTTPARAA